MVFKFESISESSAGIVKTQISGAGREYLFYQVWGRTQGHVFFKSSQERHLGGSVG